jgi:hypothetical protein
VLLQRPAIIGIILKLVYYLCTKIKELIFHHLSKSYLEESVNLVGTLFANQKTAEALEILTCSLPLFD